MVGMRESNRAAIAIRNTSFEKQSMDHYIWYTYIIQNGEAAVNGKGVGPFGGTGGIETAASAILPVSTLYQ